MYGGHEPDDPPPSSTGVRFRTAPKLDVMTRLLRTNTPRTRNTFFIVSSLVRYSLTAGAMTLPRYSWTEAPSRSRRSAGRPTAGIASLDRDRPGRHGWPACVGYERRRVFAADRRRRTCSRS